MGSMDLGVTKELAMVEARIRESIVTEEPLLHDIARYVIESGGKRIRPMVTLLAFQALGGKEIRQAVDCAAAFELIHSATLIHDDINDGGEMRRGRLAADRKSTRLNSSHSQISYAVFCLKKKKIPSSYSFNFFASQNVFILFFSSIAHRFPEPFHPQIPPLHTSDIHTTSVLDYFLLNTPS